MSLVDPGTIFSTSGGQLVPTTKPNGEANAFRIYDISFISGATASNISLKDNGSGGTTKITLAGTANASYYESYCEGFRFENGLFVQTDSNFTSILITGGVTY